MYLHNISVFFTWFNRSELYYKTHVANNEYHSKASTYIAATMNVNFHLEVIKRR